MKKLSFLVFLTCMFVGLGAFASAQDASPQTLPDNTKMNQRDNQTTNPTADQQSNNLSDRDITQQIRQAVMSDKSLSIYAYNVKIIAQNGMVTLKGPVTSEEEKKTIEAKAANVVGAGKVTNELQVKSMN